MVILAVKSLDLKKPDVCPASFFGGGLKLGFFGVGNVLDGPWGFMG